MSETATVQLTRIVQLIAELSRDGRSAQDGVSIAEIAARLEITPAQLQRDIRTLTAASDDPDAEWLQSLSVWQEGSQVSVSSQGPFRRPVRLTPDELLAIQVGLSLEGERGCELSAELAQLVGDAPGRTDADDILALANTAASEHRLMTVLYAGERDPAGTARTIEPHQVVAAHGRWYIVAWCRRAGDWRHFRADRVIDAEIEHQPFTPRPTFVPVERVEDVFRAQGQDVEDVRVRFSPAIARWILESRPDATRMDDGSAEVTYRVAEPRWLVRQLLQYGADVELTAPPRWRGIMRRALAQER